MGSELHFRKASYEPGIRDFGNGCFAYSTLIGGAAALLVFGIGHLIGASTGGTP